MARMPNWAFLVFLFFMMEKFLYVGVPGLEGECTWRSFCEWVCLGWRVSVPGEVFVRVCLGWLGVGCASPGLGCGIMRVLGLF